MKHIQVASCTPMAFDVAARTLLLSQRSEQFDLINVPLFRDQMGHPDIETLITDSIDTTRALADDEATPLAVGVRREWVCEKTTSPQYVLMYSVGFIVTCYRQSVLGVFYHHTWLPADKNQTFNETVRRIMSNFQDRAEKPPAIETVELSSLFGGNLQTAIEMPVDQQFYRVH